MARDMAAYVSISESEVRNEAVPTPGPTNYGITLNGRQEWWWESGPVDLCCIYFPLEAGVVVLAGVRAVWNSFLLCLVLHQPQDGMSLLLETIGIPLEVQGDSWQEFFNACHLIVGLAGGLAGLRAGCSRSSLAAKFSLWSWWAGLALSTILWLMWWSMIENLMNQGLEIRETAYIIAICFLDLFGSVYFIKVSWSYCTVLNSKDINLSSINDSGVELFTLRDGDEISGGVV